jgi:hypothetical protein
VFPPLNRAARYSFPLEMFRLGAAILFLLLTLSGQGASASSRRACTTGRGAASKKFKNAELQIAPAGGGDKCRAVVLDSHKLVIFSELDTTFDIALSNRDVNGDGIPDLVLEGFSGGLHCCWTYYVISLGPKPSLLLKFENNREASFLEDEKGRGFYISTEDGEFDYFDGLCHACTPFPLVFLKIDGKRLVDISPECADAYDEIVRESRAALSAQDLAEVVAMTTSSSESRAAGVGNGVRRMLEIVFAYLYSGRESRARQELQTMWPQFDQDRMWNLIQKQRREGILRYVDRAPATQSATQPQ